MQAPPPLPRRRLLSGVARNSSTAATRQAPSRPQPAIVGGNGAQQGRFPWAAQLRINDGMDERFDGKQLFCGASLVHPQVLLTAANVSRCLAGRGHMACRHGCTWGAARNEVARQAPVWDQRLSHGGSPLTRPWLPRNQAQLHPTAVLDKCSLGQGLGGDRASSPAGAGVGQARVPLRLSASPHRHALRHCWAAS